MSARPLLRPASADDAELLLVWRNEPEVRAMSRDTGIVEAADHGEWLERTLADPGRDLLIGEVNGEPIGQVRFDRLNDDECEISVSLAHARRGTGLGTELIRAGVEWLLHERGPTRVIAEVRRGNQASLGAFRTAGFRAVPGPAAEGYERLERDLGA